MTNKIAWPDGKRFAFAIFDDTDWASLENLLPVYSFLIERGFRFTKSVWIVEGDRSRGKNAGATCADPDYLRWVLNLQSQGFEIAFHHGTWHGLPRAEIHAALDKFAELFGGNPISAANHTGAEDGIYWTDARLTGLRKCLYNLLTCFRNYKATRGQIEGDSHFWGDLCKERIKYYRNFTFQDINTLAACPFMPYYDPLKPYVNYWFSASDGHDCESYNRCLSEENQDRLEAAGGACIMYTHFAKDFLTDGKLNPRFQELMARLSKKNGWFVPVATLLNFLSEKNGRHVITDGERRRLEWKWFGEKVFIGRT